MMFANRFEGRACLFAEGTERLSDVEAAMLVEVQKVDRAYGGHQGLLVSQIQKEYVRTSK